MRRVLLAIVCAACVCPPGCGGGENLAARMQSEDPGVRLQAVHQAGQQRRADTAPLLVDRLTDSEREVRVYAIVALERITGTTMGYRHWDPPEKRQQAVERWRKWLAAQRPSSAAQPPASDAKEGTQ